jgi:hypothetical protein
VIVRPQQSLQPYWVGELTVVVVHLGPSRPRWLVPCLRGLHSSGYAPLLVTDNRHWQQHVPGSARTLIVGKRSVESNVFRGGFWTLSTERFGALAEAHALIGGAILHIETDVRLAAGIKLELLAEQSASIAYPMLSEGRGSGSTVYLRNAEATRALAESLVRQQNDNGLNDMQGLWEFWSGNKTAVSVLPCTESADDARLEAAIGPCATHEAANLRGALGGIFDAASYGQFLFGTDGRNSRYGWRVSGAVNTNHFAQPQERRFVEPITWPFRFTQETSLLSLHVHSKSPRALTSRKPERDLRYPLGEERRSLDLWALRTNIAEAARRRIRNRSFVGSR